MAILEILTYKKKKKRKNRKYPVSNIFFSLLLLLKNFWYHILFYQLHLHVCMFVCACVHLFSYGYYLFHMGIIIIAA